MRIRGGGVYVSRNARLGNVEATSFQTASGAAVDTAYKSPFFLCGVFIGLGYFVRCRLVCVYCFSLLRFFFGLASSGVFTSFCCRLVCMSAGCEVV